MINCDKKKKKTNDDNNNGVVLFYSIYGKCEQPDKSIKFIFAKNVSLFTQKNTTKNKLKK